jgi:hypothetical protein
MAGLDDLVRRGVVSPDAADAAQQARDAGAARMRQAVQPGVGRQEGAISGWIDEQGGRLADQLTDAASDVMRHPEHLIGPGELGIAFNGAKVAAFREMLRAGKSFEEIGERFGITPDSARALAKSNGIPAGGMTDVWSLPGAADKLREGMAAGKSFGAIGRELGVSGPTIAKKAKQLGIEATARIPWARAVKDQTE